MDKDKKLPSYENFLSGIEYNPSEVENYFNKRIESLENELFSLSDKQDQSLTDLYNQYEDELKKYDDVKRDVLKKYLQEYQELNDQNEKDIAQIENEYYAKKSETLDKIDLENDVINKIRYSYIDKLYQAKKIPASHMREVEKKIDEEYQQHAETIFVAKDRLLRNNEEFYADAEKHLEEIEKTIRFLKELDDYSNNLPITIDAINNPVALKTIDIYLEYIKDEKVKASDISDLVKRYEDLTVSFKDALISLENRKNESRNEAINLKNDLMKRFSTNDDDKQAIIAHYDLLIKKLIEAKDIDEKDRVNIKVEIEKERDVFLLKVEADRSRLALKTSAETELLYRDQENLNRFADAVKALDQGLSRDYLEALKKNNELITSSYEAINEILEDEKNAINNFVGDTKDAKEILSYFEKRYELLAINKRVEMLEEYEKYIRKNIDDNKKLDILAFELLTNDEVRKMKLLDLRKEFLTIDDDVKIKQITYDIDREEAKDTMNAELAIKNAEADLVLLKKDFEIDKSIKTAELKNAIYVLDTRKKIDMLRCDYMCAYSRLDNVQKMIAIKNEDDDTVADINSEIQIQKIIEIALLEAISRKEEYEGVIKKYKEDIDSLDESTQQRVRYLNNVLEIERDNFDERKIKLENIYGSLRKDVYPDIVTIRKESGKKITRIKDDFANAKKREIADNSDKTALSNRTLSAFESLVNKAQDNLRSLHENNASPYLRMIDQSSFSKAVNGTVSSLVDDANYLLNDAYNNQVKPIAYPKKALANLSATFLKNIRSASSDKERERAYGVYLKGARKSIRDVAISGRKRIASMMPDDSVKMDKLLKEYDSLMKEIVAETVINTTIRLEPYLTNLDEIDEARQKVQSTLEQEISDYKKSYLDTIRTIENEYHTKLDQLNSLIQITEERKVSNNADLNSLMSNSVEQITTQKKQNIKKNRSNNDSESLNAKNKVTSLSNKIAAVNTSFEQEEKRINNQNEQYRKDMGEAAKALYKEVGETKAKNEAVLTDDLKQKDTNRNEYFRKVTLESLSVKESYQDKKSAIEDKAEEVKADKTIEYGKLFESVKNESLAAASNITKPISSFDEEIASLTQGLINKTDELTKTMTNRATAQIDSANKTLDEENFGGKKQ